MTEPNGTLDSKILNRVRGLLDKAASTEFEEEAQALRDKAMALMAAYGIEQAMLQASGRVVRDEIINTRISYKNPFSHEKHTLLHCVATIFNCRAIGTASGKSVLYADMVGHASDVERVEFLYTLLLVQAENGAAKIKAGDNYGYRPPRQVAAHTRALRAAYLVGFAEEIHSRLYRIQQHAARQHNIAHTGDGTANVLPVLASRKELVDRRYAELFPGKLKANARRYRDDGYQAGRAGGRNADLGQDRFRTGRKALA